MAFKVTMTNDDFPNDHEWSIAGLGILVNGKATTISKEQEESFIRERQMTVKDALGDSEYLKIEGTTEVSGGVKSVLGVDPNEITTEVPNLDEQTTAEVVEEVNP